MLFATTSFNKRGVGLFLRVDLFSRDYIDTYTYIFVGMIILQILEEKYLVGWHVVLL